MPAHSFEPIRGILERFSFSSKNLENKIGDPIEREILVHISPGGEGPLPCIIYLAPFTGTGFARANWRAFSETLPQRHERLVSSGIMPPSILVMPDTFTSMGGNQFIDSEILGDWGSWLNDDLRREINSRYDVSGFGLVGKSSGGYGALVRGMLDDCWDAVACHSGDCGFELLFGIEMGNTLTQINAHGGMSGFLEYVKNANSLKGDDFHTLMILAMAATYDPDSKAPKGIRLPMDMRTCELIPERWQAWLDWDPVVILEREDAQESLRNLKGLFVDCGQQDQYNIHFGTRQFCSRLDELGIEHTYEEFEDDHSSVDYRMDRSLPFLYRSLIQE